MFNTGFMAAERQVLSFVGGRGALWWTSAEQQSN